MPITSFMTPSEFTELISQFFSCEKTQFWHEAFEITHRAWGFNPSTCVQYKLAQNYVKSVTDTNTQFILKEVFIVRIAYKDIQPSWSVHHSPLNVRMRGLMGFRVTILCSLSAMYKHGGIVGMGRTHTVHTQCVLSTHGLCWCHYAN